MSKDADVLLITVNKHETEALLKAFAEATGNEATNDPRGDRLYRNLGTINGMRVFHALSEMGSGGLGGTQQTAEKGIQTLAPGTVIAVGIAFGINEKKQAIGDILISRQLQLYDLQRAGSEITLRGDKPHASPRLVNFFEGIAQTSWKSVPVRVGLLLSGDKLVDDIDYRDQLVSFEPEAIGGEMEGAGMYVACQDRKVDWIVIKAICDWGDGKKSKNKKTRQQKAARNAAEFVLHALQQASLPQQPQLRDSDLAEIRRLLSELKEELKLQRAVPQSPYAPDQMDLDDDNIWKSLIETYFKVKRITLLAEELLSGHVTYIQPIRERADALEHIVRWKAFDLGVLKEQRPATYGSENLKSALKHIHRAFFGVADWFSELLREGIRESLSPYSPGAIRIALPEWYPTLRPKTDEICRSIVEARNAMDQADSPLETLLVYEKALNELSQIYSTVIKAAPMLAEVRTAERSELAKMRKLWFLPWRR